MIKIEHTKTNIISYYHDNKRYGVKEQVLVTDAELVLVKSIPEEALLFRYKSTDTVHILPKKGMLVKGLVDYLVPILISRKEKIEEGDWVLLYTKEIVKAKKGVIGLVYETPSGIDMDFQEGLDFKILVLPEHFSKLQLHMIVDGKLKDGDKVLVECELLREDKIKSSIGELTMLMAKSPHNNESNSDMSVYKSFIKFNPHITIYTVEEKMYTRDEVMKIVCSSANYFFSQGMVDGDTNWNKWFEQNVK